MSKKEIFKIQPRDVCPGDYFKYKESHYVKYSHTISQINQLKNLMNEFLQKKAVIIKLDEIFQNLNKRRERIEKKYDEISDKYIIAQQNAANFSHSLGAVYQRQKMIKDRNEIINRDIQLKVKFEDKFKTEFEKSQDELQVLNSNIEKITNNYFHENYLGINDITKDVYFTKVKDELQKRKKNNDDLLKFIEERNKTLYAESLMRYNLRKSAMINDDADE